MLNNRTAIVSGAASGIGRAIALAFAREGASVVVADADEEGGAETVRLIGEPDSRGKAERAVFVRADASLPEDHERLVETAVERFGALHVACNNAGIGGAQAPAGETDLDALIAEVRDPGSDDDATAVVLRRH